MTMLLRSIFLNAIRSNKFNKQLYGLKKYSNTLDVPTPKPRLQDSTMMALKLAVSTSEVLTEVQRQLPAMNHKYLMQALRTIFELHKESRSEEQMKKIIFNPGFDVLLQNFKKHVRALDENEAIEAIKVLTLLGVPMDSVIVQMLLQLVRSNINFITIRQIMFLGFLLGKYKGKNHLVDALKLALPLAFQIHLPLELDKDDLPLLKDMLAYCCYHNAPNRCINNIVTGLLLHDRDIDAQTAKSVIWSLCEGNCSEDMYPTRVQLMNVCFNVLSRSMFKLSYEDVLRTSAKLKKRIIEKHSEFYNEKFMDAVADYVVEQNLDFDRSLLLARVLSRIAHTHLGIAQHLCITAASNPSIIVATQRNLLMAFINCLSNYNYTPEQVIWTEIKRQISAHPLMETNIVALPWAKFSLELASLGIYDDRILSRVFSEEFLEEYLHRENNLLDLLQILTLSEAVKVFHNKEYTLPNDIFDKARSLYPIHTSTEVLVEELSRWLGGKQYVVKNIILKSGIVLDSVICMKEGHPQNIAVQSDDIKIPIEKLNIPESSLLICIMSYNHTCFSVNSNRLRGTFRLIIDILEKQDLAVVPLNVMEWLSTPDHERMPYLIREIGYKCGEIGMKLSAV